LAAKAESMLVLAGKVDLLVDKQYPLLFLEIKAISTVIFGNKSKIVMCWYEK
jgi:hypothetical protein